MEYYRRSVQADLPLLTFWKSSKVAKRFVPDNGQCDVPRETWTPSDITTPDSRSFSPGNDARSGNLTSLRRGCSVS